MANCVFAWPNVADTGTLSGGSAHASFPLVNLLDERLVHAWRSTNAVATSTQFDVDLGTAQTIGYLALCRHNLQATATFRLRGSNSAGSFGSPLYDSGTLDVWPVQWPASGPGTLPAGHPNAATRKFTNAQIAEVRWDLVHVLTLATAARYWRLELVDTANTDGFVQASRLVLSPGYQPSGNLIYGDELGDDPGTLVGESIGRAKTFDVRASRRKAVMNFPDLPLDEALGVMGWMKRDLGLHRQVYFITDPSDTYNLQRRSFLAHFREIGLMTYAFYGAGAHPVQLEEAL